MASAISNDFSRFTVISFDPDQPGRGPYMVMQTGSDPGDMKFVQRDWVLSHAAEWIDWVGVLGMPREFTDQVIFDSVGEMMSVIERLTGPPRIRVVEGDRQLAARKLRAIEVEGVRERLRSFLREREERRG